MNLQEINANKVLFLDIETVPGSKNWKSLDSETQTLYDLKTRFQRKDDISAEEFYEERAGILAEFGKIIVISVGVITKENTIKLKSFYGDDEQVLLEDFAALLNKSFNSSTSLLCAHNGKEFDFPFIARRMIVQQVVIPKILQIQGKKPWQINHLDTMELWKFGDYKNYTSVRLLAHILGIKSPKDDIDGSEVAKVYYEDKDLERIKVYCEKDVVTVAQIFRKMRYESLLKLETS